MPPLVEDVKTCFAGHNRMVEILGLIARGKPINGRPLAAEEARQLARGVLIELGIGWPKQERK